MSDERLAPAGRPLNKEEIDRLRELYGDDGEDSAPRIAVDENPLLGLSPEEEAVLNKRLGDILRSGYSIRVFLATQDGLKHRVAQSSVGQKAGDYREGRTVTEAIRLLSEVEHDPVSPAGSSYTRKSIVPFMGNSSGKGLLDSLILNDPWTLEVSFNTNAEAKGQGPMVAEFSIAADRALALGASFTEAVDGAIQRLQTNGVIPLNLK